MASFEGSIGTPSGGFNLKVEYSISQSVSGNYSDVTATGYVKRNKSSYYPYNSQSSANLSINGTGKSYTGSYNLGSDGYKTITSNTVRVNHNSDGTKSITISFSFDGKLSNYYPNGSISKTISLPTIPRASTVSCSSPYIGDVATITIGKKSSNFTSTVTYKIGTLTGTIAEKTTETVLQLDTLSLKEQIYALIPNAKSTSGTITCTTYSGNTQIGNSATATFNLYAREDECKPEVTGEIIDTNEATINLTGDSSIIVKNASKPKVIISAIPQLSSTIKSYSINLNDGQTASSQEYTFDTINSEKITVSAVDSREYNNYFDIDLKDRVIDYVKLHFNSIELARPEGMSNEIILNSEGIWYNGSFNEETQNTLTVTIQYRESGESKWIDIGEAIPIIEGNKFSFINLSLGELYDYQKEYQFKLILSDLLNTVGNTDKEIEIVSKGIAVLEIGDELVNINGTLTVNDQNISSSDTLPIGAIVEYDGDYVPIGYKEVKTGIITAFLKAGAYSTGAYSLFDNYTKVGNGLTISNNSIVIGSGVSKTKICSNFNIQVNSAGNCYIQTYIKKNGNTIMRNYERINIQQYGYICCTIPSFVEEVSEGDEITIECYSDFAGTVHNDVYGKSYMTVEVVE